MIHGCAPCIQMMAPTAMMKVAVAPTIGQGLSIALRDVPITRNGTLPFQVENVMAATAAAWALGLDWDLIRSGLASFKNDAAGVPGRFNLMSYRGATVIADYGHNTDAMKALVAAERMRLTVGREAVDNRTAAVALRSSASAAG